MKKIALFICCILNIAAYAQQWEWLKKIPYYHSTLKTAMDSFGNIYLVAETDSPGVSIHAPIIYKLDTNGILLSQHIFPGNFKINDIKINTQEQLMITGYFTDTLQLGSAQFISAGSTDVFIGAFATNFQFIWGKRLGGSLGDIGNALAIDKNDNFFLCGSVSDTLNFEGTTLNCNATGNSFVARFDLMGHLNWVIKDSSDIFQTYSYSYANDILINTNNELLVTGRFDYLSYFFLNGLSLTIPPLDPYGYNYGYDYAIKLDLNGNSIWGKCTKKPKWQDFQFKGFTTTNSLIINSYSFNGSTNSSITLLNNNGTLYKTINIDSIIQGGSWTNYLGTINDRIYLLASKVYYNSSGAHQPNYICTISNDELVMIDSINGEVRENSLLKNSNDEYYICGAFDEILCAGNDTIKTDSIGNYNNQYNYYAYNPFVAKFTMRLISGIPSATTDLNNFQVFPNPSSRIFTINFPNYPAGARIVVRDVLGNCLLNKDCRNEVNPTIDLTDHPKGIYFVEIALDSGRTVRKIVLE